MLSIWKWQGDVDFISSWSLVQAAASYSRVLATDELLQVFYCSVGWKWSVGVGTPACKELDPVLEVQDGVVATVLLSHLLPLIPVRHFLWSYLSIGCLLRSDCISQEGSCPSLNRVSLLGTLVTC